MNDELTVFWNLITAFGVGALIGIERGWKSRGREEGGRVAGVRTFTLTGILGGILGQISLLAGEWVLASAFLSVTIMISVAYYVSYTKNSDIGITTPIALLIAFSLGAWSSYGNNIFVFGIAVLVVALLGFKPEIHKWISNIDTSEIYAGIKLLIISVILLPLLPDQGYGPYQAINPYWIWWMVVLITGLSFIGYVTTKHLGDRIGILLTALTGGLASSTAVTLSMAQMARRNRVTAILMMGVLVASVIMFTRILIEVTVVNSDLLRTLWLPMLSMLGTTLLGIIWLWKSENKTQKNDNPSLELSNPFQISMALKFGLLLAAIVLLGETMKGLFGNQGIYVLSVISGLMDVDAITLTLSKMSGDGLDRRAAVLGIILATISNTLVKGSMFAFIAGIRSSARLILIMIASGVAGLVSILFI